ncbi:MAG: DNA-3-methyladenine glycosylase 2 family protein [Geminicoccaceae bacterium]
MIQPLDAPRLREAVDRLAERDSQIAAALAGIGYPEPRIREPGFATLLEIVVAQQVSTHAAAAIWRRFRDRLGGTIVPAGVLGLTDEDFRAAGFSRRKVEYARALAEAVVSGRFPVAALPAMDDAAIVSAIAAQRGFGPWSAEVYCLFALGRIDCLPADDLALQVAAQRLKVLPARPDGKALRELAQSWRPWRGAAALFLWHYYRRATLDH